MKKRMIGWTAALVILAAAAGLLVWSYSIHHAELTAEASGDAAIKNPAKVANEGGEPVVMLDDDVQARMGVEAEAVAPMTRHPQVTAYGQLEEDPDGSFVLRSPLAGTIQGVAGNAWPGTGTNIAKTKPKAMPLKVNSSGRMRSSRSEKINPTSSAASTHILSAATVGPSV